ncbi:MAG: hypothetical protein KAW89_07295, partial [Armatimonadetes bacterium]|nr:hypothetical protein [Armatimonadota bacterium]
PFLAFLVYYLAIVFSLSTSVTHLVQLAMHLACCLLLYALIMRVNQSTWPAALAAGMLALLPLHAQAVFWFAAGQYLVAALLLLIAAHVSISPGIPTARRRILVILLLFLCVQFYELSALIALGLAAGIWLLRGKVTELWRETLPAWGLGSVIGLGFFMSTRYLAGYSRELTFQLSLAKFLGPFRVFFGWTTQGIGLEWLMNHPWVWPGVVVILTVVVVAARRSDPRQVKQMSPFLVPCILAALAGAAPFVFSSYFPVRALYPVAPWMALALIILLYWTFRRAAWVPLVIIVAFSANATFGVVSAYREANLLQQQYLGDLKQSLPQWPEHARSICVENAPANYGPVSVFKNDWVLSGALAQLYNLDFEPEVYFTDRYPRCNRASPDITAIWHPRRREMKIKLAPGQLQAHIVPVALTRSANRPAAEPQGLPGPTAPLIEAHDLSNSCLALVPIFWPNDSGSRRAAAQRD